MFGVIHFTYHTLYTVQCTGLLTKYETSETTLQNSFISFFFHSYFPSFEDEIFSLPNQLVNHRNTALKAENQIQLLDFWTEEYWTYSLSVLYAIDDQKYW